MWEIEKVKAMSDGSNSQYSAWQTWEDEMIKKSVIKRHFKMLISGNPSEALSTALEIENDNNKLVNTFSDKPTQTRKPSIMNAFSDVEEQNPNQLSILPEENVEFVETNEMPTFDLTHLSDEQIEMEMNSVAEKMNKPTYEDDSLFPTNESE